MAWFDDAADLRDALSARIAELIEGTGRIGEEAVDLALRAWDQLDDLPIVPVAFRIPPVRRQLYGHGAFMGAGPALLADPTWRRILAFLMPDVYADITAELQDGAAPASLISMFENNPVMAAFGTYKSLVEGDPSGWEFDNVGIEWDLFIDGDLADAHASAPEEGREALVERILETAVIAHSNAIDTLQENMGWCQHDDVRSTAKAKLGGVEIPAWLDLFARALRLGAAEEIAPLLVDMAREPRITEGEACRMHTFAEPLPSSESVAAFSEITGRATFSVVLEMKSLRSTPELFGDLVRALNRRGVHVAAACSFKLAEIAGVSAITQQVTGVTLPGPREVLLFHFAGDVQRAADRGSLPTGTSVMFNGASLLEVDGWFSKDPKYTLNDPVIEDLERYRERHDLHIGLYVQEGDCDSGAVALLAQLVESRPHTFTLGFAWGGLREEAAYEPGGEPRMGHGSQLSLAFIGAARGWQVREQDG